MQDTGPGNGKNAGWYEAGMPRVLAQLLPLGQLPGSLALWLGGFARLGSLARLADIWTAPGSLALWLGGFARLGSLARLTLKKFLRFLNSQELFLTRGPSRPIEALFTAQSGLTRELLTSKFHIDPRTSLLTLPGTVYSPAFSTDSGRNKLTSQNIL